MKTVGIVGGGVAGLTAGIYLRKCGVPCEIFEKNTVAGGNLTGWSRGGCVIDNCLHWLTGTRRGTALYRIWREIGMLNDDTKIQRASYFYMSELGEMRAALYAIPSRSRREFLRLSPDDGREINCFFDAVEGLKHWYCRSKGGFSFVFLRRLPVLLRYSCLSLRELADRFRHPLLRHLFTDYIGGDYMALGLVVSYAAFCAGNASLPIGGSPAAAERIAERFVSLGGVLHTGCEVKRLVMDGEEVTGLLTADGSYHAFDKIFCACDPAVTYGRLLEGAKLPRTLTNKKSLRFSALHAAFSCDSDKLPCFGTLVIDLPVENERKCRLVLREFSHEPSFAPKGKRVVQCMLLQNEWESQKWISDAKDPTLYRHKKEMVANHMARALSFRFPSIAESLQLLDVWTPATYRRYFGAPSGSFMPWYMPPRRLPPRMLGGKRPYRNVYLVTQWERSPGGVPGAAMAGKRIGERVGRLCARDIGFTRGLVWEKEFLGDS